MCGWLWYQPTTRVGTPVLALAASANAETCAICSGLVSTRSLRWGRGQNKGVGTITGDVHRKGNASVLGAHLPCCGCNALTLRRSVRICGTTRHTCATARSGGPCQSMEV